MSKRTFRKSSNACGRHSIVLPLIMNAATFSPRYSTILHSFTEGSLVGAGVPPEGGGLSPPPKDLCRKPKISLKRECQITSVTFDMFDPVLNEQSNLCFF